MERKRAEMEREAATLRSEGEKYRQGCLEALQLAEEKDRLYKALKEAGGSASDEVVALREWAPISDNHLPGLPASSDFANRLLSCC